MQAPLGAVLAQREVRGSRLEFLGPSGVAPVALQPCIEERFDALPCHAKKERPREVESDPACRQQQTSAPCTAQSCPWFGGTCAPRATGTRKQESGERGGADPPREIATHILPKPRRDI